MKLLLSAGDRLLEPHTDKSTILARLVALTVLDFRRDRVMHDVDVVGSESPPESFTFTATILTSWRSTAELARRRR